MQKYNHEFDKILCVKDEDGKLLAIYQNDVSGRVVQIYGVSLLNLDQIQSLYRGDDIKKPDEMPSISNE
jgi:hypothetical protein